MTALALWALVGCTGRGPGPTPDQQLLAGSVTLSVDRTARRARLRVRTLLPAVGVPPAERHGLDLDECATLAPLPPLTGQVYRRAAVAARCDETELALQEGPTGTYTHLFATLPTPGTACEVSIDGERIALPPLPAAPVVQVARGRLTWDGQPADELRFVIPRTEGESTICRLRDDGDAPAPTGARLQLSFASRVALALPALADGSRLPVSVIAGTWRSPSD